MKKGKGYAIDKRNSRSNVILDEDDILILYKLNTSGFFELNDLREILNFSYKGLKIHLDRLLEHDIIRVLRSPEDYKFKVIQLTKSGYGVKQVMMKSPKVISILKKFSLD